MNKIFYAAVAAVALLPAAAMAQGRTQTGTLANGMEFTASSLIVGQTGTGTAAAGGNPAYHATNAAGYSGVVGLLMRYSDGSGFVCSGSLMSSGRILTAAHCVSNGYKAGPGGKAPGLVSTTAYFYDGVAQGDDPFFYPGAGGVNQPGITAVEVSGYNVNTGYTGEVLDQNDIAVLTLATKAPLYAAGYSLYTSDINGLGFNVAGLGARSSTGGNVGADFGTGRRRQGDNAFDLRLGEFFSGSGGEGDIEFSYLSDFDNGTTTNDAACRNFGRCDLGRGALEVGIAGGDSGGGGFINGQLASVNSYGIVFRGAVGDFRPGLQSSWGEFNGYVPVFIHTDFIAGVPEPSAWALLILGLGFAGAAMRRQKTQARLAF